MINKTIDEIIKYCGNDDFEQLKTYLDTKAINENLINDIFVVCCSNGNLKILEWLIKTYDKDYNFDYNTGILKCISMNKLNILEYLLTLTKSYDTEFYYDYIDVFVFCCFHNFLDAAKIIYSTGRILINKIYNTKTKKIKKYGLIKNIGIIIFLNVNYKCEIITNEFCNLISTKNLVECKKYYQTYINEIILYYNNYFIYFKLIECGKIAHLEWLLSLCKPTNIVIILMFIFSIICDNKHVINYMNNYVTKLSLITQDVIENTFEEFIDEEDYCSIKNFYLLGYKMTKINLIYDCSAIISGMGNNDGFFKQFYLDNVEIFEKNFERKFSISMYICEIGNVDDFIWLHERLKLFNSHNDINYLKLIDGACDTFNLPIAEWLAKLYGQYEIKYVKCFDQEYLIYSAITETKKLYTKISNNELTLLQKYKQLGIGSYINDVGEDCLICLEKQDDLIKLNCGHYSCICCICKWFLNHDNTCVYCKKDIEWSQCNKIYCDYKKIINDNKSIMDNHKIVYENVTKKYNNIVNNYNKKNK